MTSSGKKYQSPSIPVADISQLCASLQHKHFELFMKITHHFVQAEWAFEKDNEKNLFMRNNSIAKSLYKILYTIAHNKKMAVDLQFTETVEKYVFKGIPQKYVCKINIRLTDTKKPTDDSNVFISQNLASAKLHSEIEKSEAKVMSALLKTKYMGLLKGISSKFNEYKVARSSRWLKNNRDAKARHIDKLDTLLGQLKSGKISTREIYKYINEDIPKALKNRNTHSKTGWLSFFRKNYSIHFEDAISDVAEKAKYIENFFTPFSDLFGDELGLAFLHTATQTAASEPQNSH